MDLGAVHTEITSATCREQPVCALVIAVYAAAPWWAWARAVPAARAQRSMLRGAKPGPCAARASVRCRRWASRQAGCSAWRRSMHGPPARAAASRSRCFEASALVLTWPVVVALTGMGWPAALVADIALTGARMNALLRDAGAVAAGAAGAVPPSAPPILGDLENAGITASVVNPHFIKHVPGRKTDMLDSERLAVLARFGLVRGSFIPSKDLREPGLVSCYRRKLDATCNRQINRLHKILDDAGIKLGAVVSNVDGVSARAMVRGLIEGRPEPELLGHARGALKRETEALAISLDADLSERHLFVLCHLRDTIEALQRQLAAIDAYLMAAMQRYAWAHGLLQTLPGIDEVAAALILIEIGDDMALMARAGSPGGLACWAALSPDNHESAGKRESGRTRHGNNVVRCILCECANAARWTKRTLAAKYKSLMVRKSHKKAIVAVAHKMIRLICVLLSRREPYRDQAIDYASIRAKKNAPRWMKQLKAIGKWPAPSSPAALAAA